MTFDYTQGDPAVSIGPNGATLKFKGGQPVMDQGYHNAILFSILSGKAWFGNAFIANPDSKFESRFEEAHKLPITLTVLNSDIPNAGSSDLKWMIKTGIMSSIDIVTTASQNSIDTVFTFMPPGSESFTLATSLRGKHWTAQFNNPAHERL